MASLIFGVVSMDWTVLAGFAALLLAVAVAAGYFPARRAIASTPWSAFATNNCCVVPSQSLWTALLLSGSSSITPNSEILHMPDTCCQLNRSM